MAITITDPATLALLSALKAGVELITPDGMSLGRLEPPKPWSDAELASFGLTREEMTRRENAPASERVSGEVVMARLRELRDAK